MADLGIIKIRKPFAAYALELGIVGRVGENEMRQIDFDCNEVLSEWSDANVVCICLRPGDSTPYSIPLTTNNGHCILTLSATEVAKPGKLTLELRVVVGDKVLKSACHTGHVLESLFGEGDAPGMPVRDALDRLESEISEAKKVASTVQEKLDNGDFNGEPGDDAEVTVQNITSALGYTPSKTPDWNQNDESASDYIKNRPGAYTRFVPGSYIEWDGQIGDRVNVPLASSVTLVKVSDDVYTQSDLNGAYLSLLTKDGEKDMILSEGGDILARDGFVAVQGALASAGSAGEIIFDGMALNLPEPGTYFAVTQREDGTSFLHSLRIPGSTALVKLPKEYVECVEELNATLGADVAPNKQLVTDNQGNKKWEDRLGHKTTEEVVILPETTKEANSSTLKMGDSPTDYIQKDGSYIVTLDGVDYECTPVESSSFFLTIGNLGLFKAGDDNGLPFLFIGFSEPNSSTISVFSDTGAHTYSIKGTKIIYTPIPGEYIAGGLYPGDGVSSFATKRNTCTGNYSSAFGTTSVKGHYSAAFGAVNWVENDYAFVSGVQSAVTGIGSAAFGYYCRARGSYQLVVGKQNEEDEYNAYAFIVGNGAGKRRSNAFTVDWDGNAWAGGAVEGTKLVLRSSTPDSAKKFNLSVDDSGTLAANEEIKIPRAYVDGLDAIEAAATETKCKTELVKTLMDIEKTDGKRWTQSNITTGGIHSIIFVNGLWIALSWGNKGIYYSEDGKEWFQSNVSIGSFSEVSYGNGVYISVGSGSGIYYSIDGKEWNPSNITSGFYELTYDGNLWVITGSDDEGIFYSEDGKEWITSNIESGSASQAIYANGIWVTLVSLSGFHYSTDGKTWVLGTAANTIGCSMCYANGVWVAATGGRIFHSTDGKEWTQESISAESVFAIRYVHDLLFALSSSDGVFYSVDGNTWIPTNITDKKVANITFANGVYVASGTNNDGLYYSVDGKVWEHSNIITGSGADFVYDNGLWMAAGASVYTDNSLIGIYYSLDGKFWYQSDVATGTYCLPSYANGVWVIGGSNNSSTNPGLYYSVSKYATTASLEAMHARVDKLEASSVKSIGGITPDENGEVKTCLFLQYFPFLGDDVSNGHTYDEIISYIEHMPNCICYGENAQGVRYLQKYSVFRDSNAVLLGYSLDFGEGSHTVIVRVSDKTAKVGPYHTSAPILVDANGGKWKLTVSTDGALSTEAITS